MIHHLLLPLAAHWTFLNVLRYFTFRAMLAAVISLVLSLLLGPALIRWLRTGQFGQPVSQYAPESHKAKKGTPTMGGLLIVSALMVASLLMADVFNLYVLVTLGVTLGFAAIGFTGAGASLTVALPMDAPLSTQRVKVRICASVSGPVGGMLFAVTR